MSRPNGVILWEGPSPVDGSPLVVIMTGLARKSQNPKTGDMLQTWIIRTDILPTEAVATGKDIAICGKCPLRGVVVGSKHGQKRPCYVNVGQAPQSVFRAYQRGAYPQVTQAGAEALVRGRAVRMGAYGDPAMAPLGLWQSLARHARTWTGYTHQWRTLVADWQPLLMASTGADDRAQAQAQGWRTFTVTPTRDPQDVACPAVAGLTTCERCSLCRGSSSGAKSVWIAPHGSGAAYA